MAVSTLQLYLPYIFSKVDLVLLLSKFLSSLNSFLTSGNVQLPVSISVCMSSACCRCLSQPQKCCRVPTAGKDDAGTNGKHTLLHFFSACATTDIADELEFQITLKACLQNAH